LVVAAAFDGGVSGEGYRSIPVKMLWLHRLLFVLLQGVDVHDGDDSDGICAGGSVRRMVILSLWSCFGVGAAVGAGVDDGSERLVYSYHGNRVGVLRCWLFQGCLQSLGRQIYFLSARDCLFGLSTFIVCIVFLGAPNVAKVGWKSYVTSSEVSSSSWSSASRREFNGDPFLGCGVGRRLWRPALKATGCVLQGLGCNFYVLWGVLVSNVCNLLYQ